MFQYTLPFIAAIIGWFTNYIAVKMLFRPRKKKKFLFIELQGIFPKRQAKLAEKIGKMVADELLSSKDIKDKILSPETMQNLSENIAEKLNDYLDNKFPKNYPVFSLLLGQKVKEKVRDEFLAEFKELAPEMINSYMRKFEESFDVEETIRQRVAILSPIKLEALIMSILQKEFRFIELVGAVLGFIIGLIQLALVNI